MKQVFQTNHLKLLFVGMALFTILVGCSNSEQDKNDAEEQEVATEETKEKEVEKTPEDLALEAVMNNAKYAEEENYEKYVETIYFPSGETEDFTQQTQQLFHDYDLDYEITDPVFEEVSDNKVVIKLNQQAIKVGGELPFDNHIAEVRHTVENMDGKWLLVTSEALSVDYLDEEYAE